ncbi:ABC transporter permease [Bradyrhizobium sp. U531]|uniref:ABC transporter permease n=1 Tax=Bradyrhizobium sp. U531 TaxID=3053458 RepID=UPI003F4451B5
MTDQKDELNKSYRRLGSISASFIYAFLLAPSAIVMIISFGTIDSMRFPPRELSLELYRAFFNDANWTGPLLQSLKIAVFSSAISTVLAAPAAYGLSRFDFPLKRFVGGLILSPLIIPSIILALGLYLYFSILGINGTNTALLAGHVIYATPFVMIVIGAGVVKLDPNLEFAATLMGATRWKMFLTVVLPQLLPSILAGWLFAFLISFDEVVLAWFLVGPNTVTLPVKMFSSIQWEISPVIAAVSTLLTLLSLLVCLPAAFLQRSTSAVDVIR